MGEYKEVLYKQYVIQETWISTDFGNKGDAPRDIEGWLYVYVYYDLKETALLNSWTTEYIPSQPCMIVLNLVGFMNAFQILELVFWES
jgi:hypothetical protein